MGSVPYATLNNIASSSWALTLDSSATGTPGSGIGSVVQALADVHQCLKIIFGTVPGEDPFRPTFGCDLTSFLDMPLPAAIPAIVSAVSDAITAWEPRITLESVTAAYNPANSGQLVVTVTWTPNLGNLQGTNTTIGVQSTTLTVGG